MTEYVVTLTPDERAVEEIKSLKSRLRDMVGQQQYLDDEPHVTLYVGDLDIDRKSSLDLPFLRRPTFEITGWEVFRDDTVTGNHTLVCRIQSQGIHEYQKEVAATLESSRRRPMIGRFEKTYDDFDERRRENLTEYGYPFIGEGWKPHLTIASIDPSDFQKVWEELEDEAPIGEYEFESVTVYDLVDGNLRAGTDLPL
jgi:2'-5' RNA ligase